LRKWDAATPPFAVSVEFPKEIKLHLHPHHLAKTTMPTYYQVNDDVKIKAILRTGFSDREVVTYSTIGWGVYLTNLPGKPDPDYPDDQLLEIILPPEVSIAQFECKDVPPEKGGIRRREWIVPASLLNKWAEIRFLPREVWKKKWERWVQRKEDEAVQDLKLMIAAGFVIPARDSKGRVICRDGEIAYTFTAACEEWMAAGGYKAELKRRISNP